MIDPSALTAGAAGADFHVIISAGRWVFGFVAYRDWTEVLLGEEVRWFVLPSWLTAVLFFALAAAEWMLIRLAGKLLKRLRRPRSERAS